MVGIPRHKLFIKFLIHGTTVIYIHVYAMPPIDQLSEEAFDEARDNSQFWLHFARKLSRVDCIGTCCKVGFQVQIHK